MDTGQASSSMLQRKFRIGYTRAARLVDCMEELGIVGQSVGSKPRELIMSRHEIEERFYSAINMIEEGKLMDNIGEILKIPDLIKDFL